METPIVPIDCETSFDTANETMTQIFSERVKLIVDFNRMVIASFVDGKVVDKFSFDSAYTLKDFGRYQNAVLEQARKLSKLNVE